ncbi:MAG: hypothetical protein OXN84_19245 [Albidovulum sp.]|nr:hypothetical protein [Albidovulum sp.]
MLRHGIVAHPRLAAVFHVRRHRLVMLRMRCAVRLVGEEAVAVSSIRPSHYALKRRQSAENARKGISGT